MSQALNHVVMIGRLTDEPRVPKNYTAAVFRLAVNRAYKRDGKLETDFFDCMVVAKNANDYTQQYIHKGDLVCVIGSIELYSYTSKKSGDEMKDVRIIVREINLLSAASRDAEKQKQAAGNEPKVGPIERTGAEVQEPEQTEMETAEEESVEPQTEAAIPAEWMSQTSPGETTGDEDLPF